MTPDPQVSEVPVSLFLVFSALFLLSLCFSFLLALSVLTLFMLKGHCHEDFAVLGQFCAKIITLRL